jgi:uncharacterized damage-inducible protein DinB
MAIDLPGPMDPSPDEREVLLTYLRAKRGDVVRSAEGLDEDQLRWTPGRLLPIIGIINHLAHVEERWIDGRYLGMPFGVRTDEFTVDRSLTGAAVIAAYAARADATEASVRAADDLTAPCLGCEGDGPPVHELLRLSGPVDLRWVLLHLVEETAHHAGHADATREMLDGRTAGELLAVVRGRSAPRDHAR